MFPGDVGVSAGPRARGCSAKCQDVGPQCGDTLHAKLSVYEVQMRPDDDDRRVRSASLEHKHIHTIITQGLLENKCHLCPSKHDLMRSLCQFFCFVLFIKIVFCVCTCSVSIVFFSPLVIKDIYFLPMPAFTTSLCCVSKNCMHILNMFENIWTAFCLSFYLYTCYI